MFDQSRVGPQRLLATVLRISFLLVVTMPYHQFAIFSQDTTLSSPQHPTQALSPYVETIPGTAVKFEMIPLPVGNATLIDPNHAGGKISVEIKPLWMGKTEVTWDEYDLYAFRLDLTNDPKLGALDAIARPTKPYGAPDRGFGHHGFPALSMTFHAAQEYCRWLSAKTGKKYRLPTAAEWEYACQAGAAEKFSRDRLDQHAWYWDNAEDKTHAVAMKQPNKWGLYDMLGNAAEWVSGNDGSPVVAGGSFKDKANQLHCGARAKQTPSWNMTDPQMPKSKWWLSDATFVGFRVVCEP
jgi:formylglycine-generating enzyme required for sulfatase activity